MDDIFSIIKKSDFKSFEKFVSKLNNINEFIVIDNENETKLTLLHVVSGIKVSSHQLVEKCVNYLIKQKEIDVNCVGTIQRNYGITPAHIAVQWHNVAILKLLIESGCDLLICDSYGQNVQDYAEKEKNVQMIKLVEKGIFNWFETNRQRCYNLTFSGFNLKADNRLSTYRNVSKTEHDSSDAESDSISIDLYESRKLFEESKELINSLKLDISNYSRNHGSFPLSPSLIPDEDSQEEILCEKVKTNLDLSNDSNDSQATEIYIYKDPENEIELIEERFETLQLDLSDNIEIDISLNTSNCSNQSNESKQSIESIDDFILKMTNSQLYNELENAGIKPGPINGRTRNLYQKKVNRIRKNINKSKHQPLEEKNYYKLSNYPLEFHHLIKKTFPFEEAIEYENLLIKEFESNSNTERSKQTFFVYLLLDPSISNNLPARANFCLGQFLTKTGVKGTNQYGDLFVDFDLFSSFVLSIFYVGKGQSNRAYQHFYEAVKCDQKQGYLSNGKATAKTDKILSIWAQNKGPISLHCFTGISSDEAYTREALMIDVLSLTNLTNQISGQYRCQLKLNSRQRNILGTYLLFKAFIILLLNGERQIRRPKTNKI